MYICNIYICVYIYYNAFRAEINQLISSFPKCCTENNTVCTIQNNAACSSINWPSNLVNNVFTNVFVNVRDTFLILGKKEQ